MTDVNYDVRSGLATNPLHEKLTLRIHTLPHVNYNVRARLIINYNLWTCDDVQVSRLSTLCFCFCPILDQGFPQRQMDGAESNSFGRGGEAYEDTKERGRRVGGKDR